MIQEPTVVDPEQERQVGQKSRCVHCAHKIVFMKPWAYYDEYLWHHKYGSNGYSVPCGGVGGNPPATPTKGVKQRLQAARKSWASEREYLRSTWREIRSEQQKKQPRRTASGYVWLVVTLAAYASHVNAVSAEAWNWAVVTFLLTVGASYNLTSSWYRAGYASAMDEITGWSEELLEQLKDDRPDSEAEK